MPRTASCSARTGYGVQGIWSFILEHHAMASASGWLEQLRREQNLHWMHENLEQALMQLFLANPAVRLQLPLLEQRVTTGQVTAANGANEVISLFKANRS
jgi:LAO/AO transport system kinase